MTRTEFVRPTNQPNLFFCLSIELTSYRSNHNTLEVELFEGAVVGTHFFDRWVQMNGRLMRRVRQCKK
jgi:hypothetical protein